MHPFINVTLEQYLAAPTRVRSAPIPTHACTRIIEGQRDCTSEAMLRSRAPTRSGLGALRASFNRLVRIYLTSFLQGWVRRDLTTKLG